MWNPNDQNMAGNENLKFALNKYVCWEIKSKEETKSMNLGKTQKRKTKLTRKQHNALTTNKRLKYTLRENGIGHNCGKHMGTNNLGKCEEGK